MRRDAVSGSQLSIFFPVSILHWHFRATTPYKLRLTTLKTPKNDRFLGKWEIVALLFGEL